MQGLVECISFLMVGCLLDSMFSPTSFFLMVSCWLDSKPTSVQPFKLFILGQLNEGNKMGHTRGHDNACLNEVAIE